MINYAHLARKYLNADVIVHDRTYEGLEWKGPGKKPSKDLFESFQKEEERIRKIDEWKEANNIGLMQERQHQAKVDALEKIRPLEHKIEEEQMRVREKIMRHKLEAKELQEQLKTRDELLDCWNEISAAQALVNAEAEQYLKDTDFFFTRETETGKPVPQEVIEKRALARERIDRGQLVFTHWRSLREKEMPSRGEIQEAIKKGGEELERIRKVCQDIALRYPKPRRQRTY